MQIIHCSPYRKPEGKPRTDKKKQAAKNLGANWLDQLKAEDAIIEILSNHLDDDYYLICNADLVEDSPDADMLLFGPNGVWVFEFVHTPGSFRAEGEDWLALNDQSAEYEPVSPGPLASARDNANAVYDYLHSKDLPVPWVNPVLILTADEASLHNDGAAVSAIRADEAREFVAREVRDLDAVMNEQDVQRLYDALAPFLGDAVQASATDEEEEEEIGGKRTRLLGMTAREWLVILVLAFMNICLLGVFAVIVMFEV
jgi:hypothetical protein